LVRNAPGADQLARDYAIDRGLKDVPFPAPWTRYGHAAGAIRNQQMIDEGKPDIAIAFPGNTGTADMTRRVRAANIPLIEVGR
jgi:hypothetical protein